MPGWSLFLLAVTAALLTMGGPCYPPPEGLNSLAKVPDGVLVVSDSSTSQLSRPYMSYDGGVTWQVDDSRQVGNSRDSSIVTPGGDSYLIEGTQIVRVTGGKSEVVYDAGYLRDKANLALQYRATGEEDLTKAPKSIIHDPDSGNLIVAMGWEGVVVIPPDGSTRQIAVGPYAPTDFSASSRLRLMATKVDFWVAALMVAVSFSGVAIVLPRCREPELVFGAIATLTIGAAVALPILSIKGILELLDFLIPALLFLLLLLPVPSIVLLIAWPAESTRRIGLTLGLALLLAAGSAFVFPGFGIPQVYLGELPTIVLLLTGIPAIIVVVVGVIPYRPRDAKGLISLLPVGGILLSTVLVTGLWMLYVIPESTVKWTTLALAAGIALLTFAYVRRRQWQNQPRHGEESHQGLSD